MQKIKQHLDSLLASLPKFSSLEQFFVVPVGALLTILILCMLALLLPFGTT